MGRRRACEPRFAPTKVGRFAPTKAGRPHPPTYAAAASRLWSNWPWRRKYAVCRAASGDTTRPLWLVRTTQWSERPGRRVSASATVPSEASSIAPSRLPSPCGTEPAIRPTSALPCQSGRPSSSSSLLRPSARPQPWSDSDRAVPLPRSGEPRQTTR
ncbi:hypothetical protein G6F35_015460 [Rhizopus arrhizus]|nr:hypothetical protein G6F35_015460 [Rhizopus arrhizus]